MNFYPRYCGDYQRDTADLTLVEHGAYTMLLDAYYSTEAPLPADVTVLFRIARAMTPDEQDAVRRIADRFFPVEADGLRHNTRADREIPTAQKRIDIARQNGKTGGRPPKQKPTENPAGFSEKPSGLAKQNPAETQRQSSPSPEPQVITSLANLAVGSGEQKRRRHRMPDDFCLTDQMRERAVSYWSGKGRHDLDPDTEFMKFRAHHTGKGSRQEDWGATWQTWYCNAVEFNRPRLAVAKPTREFAL